MEDIKLMQPIKVQNDSNIKLSVQLSDEVIIDHRGERAGTPEVCLLVDNGKNDIPIMFTPQQTIQLIEQLCSLLKVLP